MTKKLLRIFRRRDDGSLLVEAVVALALIAVLFAAFSQSSQSATQVQRTAQYSDIATQAAQGLIEQARSASWATVGFTGSEAGYTATGRDGKPSVRVTLAPMAGLVPTQIVTVNGLRLTLNTNVTWDIAPAAVGAGGTADFGIKAIAVQAKWTETTGKVRTIEVRATRTPSVAESVPSGIPTAQHLGSTRSAKETA